MHGATSLLAASTNRQRNLSDSGIETARDRWPTAVGCDSTFGINPNVFVVPNRFQHLRVPRTPCHPKIPAPTNLKPYQRLNWQIVAHLSSRKYMFCNAKAPHSGGDS